MRGAELTDQHSSSQQAKETGCICTVDANELVLLLMDLEDTV